MNTSGSRIHRYFSQAYATCIFLAAAGCLRIDAADMQAMRLQFDAQMQKISLDCTNVQQRVVREYSQALLVLQISVQQKGDLEALLAARQEKERVDKDKTLLEKSPAGAPEDLVAVQNQYREAWTKAEIDKNRRTVALMQAYTNQLAFLKRDLVQKKQPQAVASVADEIKKISFMIADVSSRIPAVAPEQKPAETKPSAEKHDVAGVVVMGNVALASAGAVAKAPAHADLMNDGDSTHYTGSDGFASGSWPCELSLTFPKVYKLKVIRFLLWDSDSRYYRYAVDVTADGKEWTQIVDHSDGQWKSWQEISFTSSRPVKAIRIKGLYNSANSGFYIVELEAYCTAAPPRKHVKKH
jgi:hypothetical protein